MVDPYSTLIGDLIDRLERLPGIGPKSAQRIAFHLLQTRDDEVSRLASSMIEARRQVRECVRCCNLAVLDECEICSNARRDRARVCVVEDPRDVFAIERTGAFNGLYHVLHGSLNPMEGIGPEELRISELLRRLSAEDIEEVILGTNPNLEGEATSMYLVRLLHDEGVAVTGLARGLPTGGDLEYADEVTLGRALLGRREFPAAEI